MRAEVRSVFEVFAGFERASGAVETVFILFVEGARVVFQLLRTRQNFLADDASRYLGGRVRRFHVVFHPFLLIGDEIAFLALDQFARRVRLAHVNLQRRHFARVKVAFRAFVKCLALVDVAHVRAQIFRHGRRVPALELDHRAVEDGSGSVDPFVGFERGRRFEGFPAFVAVVGRGAGDGVFPQLVGLEVVVGGGHVVALVAFVPLFRFMLPQMVLVFALAAGVGPTADRTFEGFRR